MKKMFYMPFIVMLALTFNTAWADHEPGKGVGNVHESARQTVQLDQTGGAVAATTDRAPESRLVEQPKQVSVADTAVPAVSGDHAASQSNQVTQSGDSIVPADKDHSAVSQHDQATPQGNVEQTSENNDAAQNQEKVDPGKASKTAKVHKRQ